MNTRPISGAALLMALLPFQETQPSASAPATRPSALVGGEFGAFAGMRWLREEGKPFSFADHPATLVRWWTDGCPFCEASLPALGALRERHLASGLELVAVYHAKPLPKEADLAIVRAVAAKLRISGPIAIDDQWRKLESLWKRGAPKAATSLTFLVDRKGIVRWIHPGPRLHRSKDPREARADADMAELEKLVEALLAEQR